MRPRNFAYLTTFIGVFPRRMLGSGERKNEKNVLLVNMHADCLGGGELKTVLGLPILHAVNAQLHIALSILFNNLPRTHRAKSSTNKDQDGIE